MRNYGGETAFCRRIRKSGLKMDSRVSAANKLLCCCCRQDNLKRQATPDGNSSKLPSIPENGNPTLHLHNSKAATAQHRLCERMWTSFLRGGAIVRPDFF